jgi:DNA polymerase III epsilon subunit family exonuclease
LLLLLLFFLSLFFNIFCKINKKSIYDIFLLNKKNKIERNINMALEWRNKGRRKEELFKLYKPGKSMIVFDTETTGLSENAKIIQFSAIEYLINDDYSLTEVSIVDTYINPEEKLKAKITELTGISDIMLEYAQTEKQLAPQIFDYLNSVDFLAAYNTPFDIGKLNGMSKRTGNPYNPKPTIDVCEMARDMIPKSEVEQHKLEMVSDYLFTDNNHQFHNSIEDVRATAQVLVELVRMYREFEEEKDKLPAHLEKAHIFVNPRRPSMQRINLKLSVGEDGDIFYDIKEHYWSCKSTSQAKKMYNKYIIPFKYSGIDDLASSWLKFRREKQKEANA